MSDVSDARGREWLDCGRHLLATSNQSVCVRLLGHTRPPSGLPVLKNALSSPCHAGLRLQIGMTHLEPQKGHVGSNVSQVFRWPACFLRRAYEASSADGACEAECLASGASNITKDRVTGCADLPVYNGDGAVQPPVSRLVERFKLELSEQHIRGAIGSFLVHRFPSRRDLHKMPAPGR